MAVARALSSDLRGFADLRVAPEIRVLRLKFLDCQFHYATHQLGCQIDLPGQVTATISRIMQAFAGLMQGGIIPRSAISTLVPVGGTFGDFVIERHCIGR